MKKWKPFLSGYLFPVVVFVVLLVIAISFVLWASTWGMFQGAPEASRNEIWICKAPFAYFTWGENDRGHGYIGKILLGESLNEYEVLFEYGSACLEALEENTQYEYGSDRTLLLTADYNFSKNKIVMKIRKGTHAVYADDYDEIVFERHVFDPEKDELPKLSANGN